MLKATLTEALADLGTADAMVTVYAAGMRAGTVEENCAKLQAVLDKVRAKVGLAAAHCQGIAGTARRLGAEVGVMLDGLRPGEDKPMVQGVRPTVADDVKPCGIVNAVTAEFIRLVDGGPAQKPPKMTRPAEVNLDKAGV